MILGRCGQLPHKDFFEDDTNGICPLPPSCPVVVDQSLTQVSQVSQQMAASVVQNLTYLTSTLQFKFIGNIIQNIQLTAECLSLITVVS